MESNKTVLDNHDNFPLLILPFTVVVFVISIKSGGEKLLPILISDMEDGTKKFKVCFNFVFCYHINELGRKIK